MTGRSFSVRIFAIVASCLCLGCSRPYVRAYEAHVEANRTKMASLRTGMTKPEVEAHFGSGTLVDYKRIQLRNPWKQEVLRTKDRGEVEILYYVTDGQAWRGWPDRLLLTPVIFEDATLVGWGWSFLDAAPPKYVSGPAISP